MDIERHLAKRVSERRKALDLTLDRLAELSGVSRSMISLIERAETSATAAVLHKLAGALGVSLASLFSQESSDGDALPVARFAEQPSWTDPASGYVRRHVSPIGYGSPLELAEVTFPAGGSVTFDSPSRHVVTHQQVWMLDGEMEVAIGDKPWRLKAGDCLAMTLTGQVSFRNPTRKPARYAIALTTTTQGLRKIR